MSDQTEQAPPEPTIQRRRRPSVVWLIPAVALAAGIWLIYHSWSQKGPTIEVAFPRADGIVAAKTEVRYKAVPVGKVVDVFLDHDLKPVVRIELSKSIGDRLDCSARFWVVRPRVRGAEISGLGTIFSGTYIGMTPRSQEKNTSGAAGSCYVAVDTPPRTKPNRPGRTYVLTTQSMGSLQVGVPIYYKRIDVGEIINYRLVKETGTIELEVFVEEPYHQFVRSNTRFWNTSGLELKIDSTGAELKVESLTSLLVGGVAFETPPSTGPTEELPAGHKFVLHRSHASSREKKYSERLRYTVYFRASLRGLVVDSPVLFEGMRVGHVENIEMRVDHDTLRVKTPVIIAIEPKRFSDKLSIEEAPQLMRKLVARGMRAKLESVSLVTGTVGIALSMEKHPPPARIRKAKPYPVLPSAPSPVEKLSRLAVDVATELKRSLVGVRKFIEGDSIHTSVTSLNKVLSEARKTVQEAHTLLSTARKETLPELTGQMQGISGDVKVTLKKVQLSLAAVERVLARNSPARHDLKKLVEELTGAARAFRLLNEALSRQPESLLRGRRERK